MATSILAPTTTAGAPSSDVTVADTPVTIGLYVASGNIPAKAVFPVYIATPGADTLYQTLDCTNRIVSITSPCVARVVCRETGGVAVGVFSVP